MYSVLVSVLYNETVPEWSKSDGPVFEWLGHFMQLSCFLYVLWSEFWFNHSETGHNLCSVQYHSNFRMVTVLYSQHPKSRPSSFQMVIFQIQFVSGFQMVVMTASLDRFIIKKIFFYDNLFIKRSRLVPTI
jgi:hypothetical protein